MIVNLIHRIINTLLRVNSGQILNSEFGAEAPQADIATELRTIVDELKNISEMDLRRTFFGTMPARCISNTRNTIGL